MASFNPASIGESCTCLALRKAARDIARRYDEAFRPLDINNGQFAMLTAIAGLQPAGIQALGRRLGMDRTTVTAALKPLERRGLVQIDVSEGDLRGRAVTLTPQGQAILKDAVPLWKKVQAETARQLGGEHEMNDFRKQLALL